MLRQRGWPRLLATWAMKEAPVAALEGSTDPSVEANMLGQRQYSLMQLLLFVTWAALAAVLIHYLLVTRGRLLEWIGNAIACFVLAMLAAVGVGSLFHALRQIWYWPKTTARVVRYCIKR